MHLTKSPRAVSFASREGGALLGRFERFSRIISFTTRPAATSFSGFWIVYLRIYCKDRHSNECRPTKNHRASLLERDCAMHGLWMWMLRWMLRWIGSWYRQFHFHHKERRSSVPRPLELLHPDCFFRHANLNAGRMTSIPNVFKLGSLNRADIVFASGKEQARSQQSAAK